VAVGDKVNVGNQISRRLRTPETVHHPNVKIYVSPDHRWFEHYRESLLPCIGFIFSRNGCDAAVEQCLQAGLDLTTGTEKNQILEIADRAALVLAEQDRDALGFWGFRDGLRRGFAAHHAGLLPLFKEIVEELFAAGLIKVVFATETLALGINMPARTVVIERLVKFDGESHKEITPGEYTQLTGQIGR